MEMFAEFLARINNPEHRDRMEEVLNWVAEQFPNLVPEVKWNQPMFTNHGTYIIGYSVAKHHIAVGPENAGIIHFSKEIEQAGYRHTANLIRFPWDSPFDFSLLEKLIEFNVLDKANCSSFWRK